MAFQVAGASATGRSHLEKDAGCEDAWHVVRRAEGVVACVCDGAGSASRSAEGANALAVAVAESLANRLTELHTHDISKTLVDAIVQTRDELAQLGSLPEFHATLCGIAITADQSLVFHLGDGLILGVNPDDWSDYVVSEPENGEFAETTYFFTLPQWQSHLRVFSAPKRYRTWFLMSDGCASFAAKSAPWRPTSNFLEPVHDYLSGQANSEVRNQALLSTLQSPATDKITADDKTLVWVHEHGAF
ncbi:PP2C family serine/threonine-protein phosphatase [uncultured Marinobacter sp.]|uniref:PP2C family serine/threonine-protein phosphatase n=1 Tax=uncultured Marinobacter sp. TaxID=187379 RepID=UPI00261BCE7C|nr:PP2C family serine/threonine-protein phosphatase [uncultured Marinobacter sp.]